MTSPLQGVYESLGLPDFERVRSKVTGYLAGLRDCRRNDHPELDESRRRRIAAECERFFDEWGYGQRPGEAD